MSYFSPFHVSRKLLAFVLPLLLLLSAIGAPAVSAAPRLALIHGDTVSGPNSLEEQAAVAAGFTVTIVDDATWALMTAAEFGQYDLLIVGDPTCTGNIPPGLVASAPQWGPVVLGMAGGRTQAGNRLVIGTDPVYHQSQGGLVLVSEGVAFAGKQPGRTGMYLDLSCAGFNVPEVLTLLNAISSPVASGSWTVDASPPCGGSVSLIATVPGSFPTLTTATIQGWGCSVHEAFPTFKSDFAALAIATDTIDHPTCGVDHDTGQPACGEAYLLVAGSGIVVASGSISVTPLDDTNPVDTDHTVTAHVSDTTGPLVGQLVAFEVTGANAGAVGTCVPALCVSDASGNVSFTYHGTNTGDDTIKASFTDASGSLQSATAQKHWTGVVGGQPATLDLTPPTATNPVGTSHTVTATVLDASGNPVAAGTVVNFVITSGPHAGFVATGLTDATGRTSFTYLGSVVGTDTIRATAVGGTNPSDTATKTWEPSTPRTLTLEPDHATNPVGTTHCVTATVRDEFGNPFPGAPVEFVVTGANPQPQTEVVTGPDGTAQFCYLGTHIGDDDIFAEVHIATSSPPSDEAHKTWIAGAPATVVLTPPTATNTVLAQHCVTATVRDAFGNPVPGVPVTFTVTGANTTGATIATGPDGKATFCYTGTDVGADVITARVPGIANPATAAKVWVPPAVDHYKCYGAEQKSPRPVSAILNLKDQFGEVRMSLGKADGMCNPVSKNGEPVFQPDGHFKVYELKKMSWDRGHDDSSRVTSAPTTSNRGDDHDGDNEDKHDGDAHGLRVEVTNQFGTQVLRVKKAVLLFVPASKSEIPPANRGDDPGAPPRFVDHYLCYEVEGGRINQTVTLVDQFGRDVAKVRNAELLCNPVSKNGGRVLQPDRHLVCYTLKSDHETKRLLNMHDQFGLSVLRTEESEMLCVPSTKRVLPPTPGGHDD